ncbi:MAG: mannose-1-phosphate guanylyltransferase [Deltaproteobacteria bacterium]|nr:mannose-1-phosphate guanylyltransferase [Deltaproteobacteria bacterium]
MAFHSVIMAGGSGTRFWPLSRRDRPKQLLAITGDRTMLRQTSERVAAVTPPARQWVVCGTRHEAGVRAELPELPAAQILVEPIGRNTAPCIGLAALHLCAVDRDAVACVLPSDAFVPDAAAFGRHMQAAEAGAQAGHITTLGLRPTRAETGYGYIRMAAQQSAHGGLPLHAVDRFVEKPDRATAEKYLADGSYLWNAGIFVFRAAHMLEAIERHLPALHAGLQKLQAVLGTPRYADVLREVYPALPSISIDYGVMEKEPGLYVVPSTFPWSDVGSFAALPEVLPVDAAGNLLRGDVLARDARDCVVDARAGRLCAVVGVQGLIVVDTPDALLVIPKDRAQDVGKLLDVLKERGKDQLL